MYREAVFVFTVPCTVHAYYRDDTCRMIASHERGSRERIQKDLFKGKSVIYLTCVSGRRLCTYYAD